MISVRELKKTYSPGTKAAEEVLHGVSFDLPETGFVCILGRSGSGKTSLLNAIGGLDVFDSGSVDIDGTHITNRDTREMERLRNINFGYVFQNYYLLPEHSAAYNVYLGLHSLDLDEREKLKRVEDALRKVDMLRFRKRLVGELSGGQQQRIAIARAIAKSPKVIFADEPTGNLDEESTLNICSVLKRLSKTSLVVMVTHEERLADFFADRIITISEGRISGDNDEWTRGDLVSADRNSIYAGDYTDDRFASDGMNIRVITAGNAEPADITLVVEDGRIIIKTDDPRLVMYSKLSDPPFIKEGSRPRIDISKLETAPLTEEETERPPQKQRNSGLGLKMLFAEMRTTASKKRLRNTATALFIILLSLMMLLSITDMNEAAKVDPMEFISEDSHVLELKFSKGKNYNDKSSYTVTKYIPEILRRLDERGLDYDLVPHTNMEFMFYDNILPQYDSLAMSFGKYSIVDIERLDPSTIVYGRMPERSDEIVVDRWVIKNCTDSEGIVQNFIPDSEYMIGKHIHMKNKNFYSPTIVGICDSGEPSIYMYKNGMLAVGVHGLEAIPYSEFVSITGMTDLEPVASGECLVIKENAGKYYTDRVGSVASLTNDMRFYFKDVVRGTDPKSYGITVPMIIADEDVEPLLRYAVETTTHFDVWCADKAQVKNAIAEPLPGELEDVLLIDANDTYQTEYAAFMERRSVRLQTRFIITAAVGLLCLVMLYVIQRFRVGDRMGMIAVYRMLGIPGHDVMGVFILENILLALKYAAPTVFIGWAAASLALILSEGAFALSIPVWVPFVTIAAIIAAEVILAVLSVLRLIGMPPAKIASKYDF